MADAPNVRSLDGERDSSSPHPDPDAERHVHIVLLGLMGSGKSTVGHLVANELGRPFVDSDSIVELRSGDLPPRYVERAGTDELHREELDAFRQVVEQRDSVVFAAAASVVDRVTRDDLDAAWCVWLDASPSVLAERIDEDDHERPLLGDRPDDVLAAQHDDRAARGRELSHLTVDTDRRTPTEVAACICRAWRERSDARR